ncbi:hypothetical protein C7S16_3771 [Burkholderia thailandensis]|uniref:Uncharacterized protein n=1 Tax=Burkholderia thailandensis TaxID=57975 RepID=A0AAW9CX29_BURTH|nr:hypothetical protein [Burkholderia thailandensis]
MAGPFFLDAAALAGDSASAVRASDRGRGQARDSTRVATCRGAIGTPMTCFFRARFRASMFGFFLFMHRSGKVSRGRHAIVAIVTFS